MLTYPLVSIALCTYNGEKYLEEQLDSLIGQTYPNLEIIVVDDCSKDQTLSILKDYAERFPRLSIFQNESNLGYIKNFEKAILLCKGDFIALSDQDDIWSIHKIELQMDAVGNSLLIYHDSEFIDQQGMPLHKKMSDLINMIQGDNFKPLLFFNSVSGHACLFSRELIQHTLPFPKGLFHDRWLAFAATNLGEIKYLDRALVNYRQHENSDTNILKLERKKDVHSIHGRQRIQKTITELEVMAGFKLNKNPEFITHLLTLYQGRLKSRINIGLVIFLYLNYRSLLEVSKKGTLSKLNFIFKHIWGAKLKPE